MSWSVVVIVSILLAYVAFNSGGVRSIPLYSAVAALAVLSMITLAHSRAPRLPARLLWPLLLAPVFVALQLVPLPRAILAIVSPERAGHLAVLSAVLPGNSLASLSVEPAATLEQLMVVAAWCLLLLLARELAWRNSDRLWMLAVPVVVVAALEAAFALLPINFGAGTAGVRARGTYANPNHFANLLGIALPFPLMYALAAVRRPRQPRTSPLGPALLACAGLAVGTLLLLGIIQSLSRMGFIAALIGVLVCGAGAVREFWHPACNPPSPRRRHAQLAIRALPLLVPLAVLLLFVFLAPGDLIARYSALELAKGLDHDDRLRLWSESTHLIAAYPIFGCGLGGYESAFAKFKRSAPTVADEFAHNDYLQALAELGVIGFTLLAALVLAIVIATFRAAAAHTDLRGRALAIAALAAFATVLVHEIADFSLYMPANALTLAWISGLAVSVMFSCVPQPRPELFKFAGRGRYTPYSQPVNFLTLRGRR